jgi:hypothetical protein
MYEPFQYYDPDTYTLTQVGDSLIWQIVAPPATQIYIWRGSALTTGDTTDGGTRKEGSPRLVRLNLFHDGIQNWTIQCGIGPTGAAATAAGLALPTYPIPAGPGPYPPASAALAVRVGDDLIVAHGGAIASTLQVCAVVLEP